MRAQVPPGALVHALRHSFAMDLLDNGASIVEVQTLLGHESVATTRRYLAARPHQLRDAIQATTASRTVSTAIEYPNTRVARRPSRSRRSRPSRLHTRADRTGRTWACELISRGVVTEAVVWGHLAC